MDTHVILLRAHLLEPTINRRWEALISFIVFLNQEKSTPLLHVLFPYIHHRSIVPE
ncbi:hypothetical protein OROMI_010218 [Orobanche minor]